MTNATKYIYSFSGFGSAILIIRLVLSHLEVVVVVDERLGHRHLVGDGLERRADESAFVEELRRGLDDEPALERLQFLPHRGCALPGHNPPACRRRARLPVVPARFTGLVRGDGWTSMQRTGAALQWQ